MIKPIHPENGASICLNTEFQMDFLNSDRSDVIPDSVVWNDLKKSTQGDHSQPRPVELMWENGTANKLIIWENGGEKRVFECCGNNASVYNLKADTVYYWCVQGDGDTSKVFSFTTQEAMPRWINVDGITNVRDCGAWRTLDGKRIRQGLLYRGSEMNNHVNITSNGLDTLRRDLNLKTVLDIRAEREQVCNVYGGAYLNVPVLPYAEYLQDKETNKRIFDILSDESNYPLYFHCWGGADRTGTIAFLLNAVLDVPYESLIDDYELTSLSVWGIRSRNTALFDGFLKMLNEYAGDTVNEKAKSFMISCGVTCQQLQHLADNLKEECNNR